MMQIGSPDGSLALPPAPPPRALPPDLEQTRRRGCLGLSRVVLPAPLAPLARPPAPAFPLSLARRIKIHADL